MSNIDAQARFVAGFDIDPTLEDFAVPADRFIQSHAKDLVDANAEPIVALASGIAVITSLGHDGTAEPRILLLRRAASDSMPNLWETPGGGVDDTDVTVLHGAARELLEEAGLHVAKFERLVGPPNVFSTRRGLKVARFTFACQVKDATTVTLDPNEHSAYVWATQAECECGRVTTSGGGDGQTVEIPFTTKEQGAAVLRAFETGNSSRS